MGNKNVNSRENELEILDLKQNQLKLLSPNIFTNENYSLSFYSGKKKLTTLPKSIQSIYKN